jgi:hypothetical protein
MWNITSNNILSSPRRREELVVICKLELPHKSQPIDTVSASWARSPRAVVQNQFQLLTIKCTEWKLPTRNSPALVHVSSHLYDLPFHMAEIPQTGEYPWSMAKLRWLWGKMKVSSQYSKLQTAGSNNKVKVTLRLTVTQSICLGVEPNLGLLTRDFFFKVIVLSFWDALSEERSGLSFVSLLSLQSTIVSHYLQQLFTLN